MVQFLKYLWVFQNPKWIIKNVTKAAWPVDMFHENMASIPEAWVRFHRRKVRFHHHQKMASGLKKFGDSQPSQVATSQGPPHHFILQPLRHCLRGWRVFDGKSFMTSAVCLDLFWSETCMWRAFFSFEFNDVGLSGKIYSPLKDKLLKCSLWIQF